MNIREKYCIIIKENLRFPIKAAGVCEDNMEKLILIDGNSLINRAFYALPILNNVKGELVNAVYGFANMLIRAINDYKPDYIAVAFDLHAPTFRHKMYAEYKAGRRKMPDELALQLPILKDMLRLMNIKILEKETYEADDIIGTMSRRFPVKSIILTGDRDSLQLINDNVDVYLTKRGLSEILAVNDENIVENFGFNASQVVDFKSLAGDSSDNIPGVPGIGEKTAVDLLQKYGSLDGVYEHLDDCTPKMKDKLSFNRELAELSRKLATIDVNVPVECSLEECKFDFPFDEKVKRFFIDMAFKSLYKKDELFSADGAENYEEEKNYDFEKVVIKTEAELIEVLPEHAEFLAYAEGINGEKHFTFDGKREFEITGEYSLLDPGITDGTFFEKLNCYFSDKSVPKYFYDAKKTLHKASDYGTRISGYEDVRLKQYLADQALDRENEADLLELKKLPVDFPACSLVVLDKSLTEELSLLGMTGLYEKIELPLVDVLFDMEKTGVLVDKSTLEKLGRKFSAEANDYAAKIYEEAGEKFNINSPKQLAAVLFEKMCIPYPKKTKKYSTSAEILESLRYNYPIVDYILKYRAVSKLLGTYVEGLGKLICSDGRVRTEYKQMMTATGRLSSVEPNLQNIPVREQEGKELRAIFIAGEGNTLVSADYSQIELRLMAHFSADPNMLDIYNRGGDIHAMTASLVFGVPLDKVTPEMRRKAKAVNFGIIYGISEYGLSESVHCSVKEAKKFIEAYFASFPRVKDFVDKTVENAKKTGEVRTLFGRRRKISELSSSNFMTRSFGERAAMNTPLQGSAADIIKIAMISVYEKLKDTKVKLILQIHDELIVECPDEEVENVKKILTDCMENAVKLTVPLTVDVESGKSWIDC